MVIPTGSKLYTESKQRTFPIIKMIHDFSLVRVHNLRKTEVMDLFSDGERSLLVFCT